MRTDHPLADLLCRDVKAKTIPLIMEFQLPSSVRVAWRCLALIFIKVDHLSFVHEKGRNDKHGKLFNGITGLVIQVIG